MKVLRVAANSAKKALSHKENGWVRKFNIRSESWLAWLKKKSPYSRKLWHLQNPYGFSLL